MINRLNSMYSVKYFDLMKNFQLKYYKKIFWLICLAFLNCKHPQKSKNVSFKISNNLDFKRKEVFEIHGSNLDRLLENHNPAFLRIRNKKKKSDLPIQWISDSSNANHEIKLLIQVEIPANSTVAYEVFFDSSDSLTQPDVQTYSRFVPERTDDYAWENDKVAFRTYGPTGQIEALQNIPGSTLSSGIDLWLKRTDKLIINKWYRLNEEQEGYYHTDHGEGYDPYHVGKSRGTGGIGVFKNDSLQVSENFSSYKTLETGPLRTIFQLKYEPWSEFSIKETKTISLDVGSNFSRFEVDLSSDTTVPNYTIGITLHEKEGQYNIYRDLGILSHWERIDDSEIGEGIIIDPSIIDSAFVYTSPVPDQSHLFINTYPKNKIIYYAGFAWNKSNQIASKKDWDVLLKEKALCIQNPLVIKFK